MQSDVAQAGALVYCTTPIVNSNGGDDATDGCFDGRNHLYFSDGAQWIPLANCLPSSEPNGHCQRSFKIESQEYEVGTDQSGQTAFITQLQSHGDTYDTVQQKIFLPPLNDGLCYKFILTPHGDEVYPPQDIRIYPSETGEIFDGSINWIDSGSEGGGSNSKGINELPGYIEFYSGAFDSGSYDANCAEPGDWVEILSSDGKWYVTGQSWEPFGVRFGPEEEDTP